MLLPSAWAYDNARCIANYDPSLACSQGLGAWNPNTLLSACAQGPYTCSAGLVAVFYDYHAMVRPAGTLSNTHPVTPTLKVSCACSPTFRVVLADRNTTDMSLHRL